MKARMAFAAAAVAAASLVPISAALHDASPADAASMADPVQLSSSSNGGITTPYSLQPGTYIIEISGTYQYGLNGSSADAECAELQPDPTFQRSRFALLDPTGDPLDVTVNGRTVDWQPTIADAFGCNSTDHTYRIAHVVTEAGPVHFAINDNSDDNAGALTIKIGQNSERLVEVLSVDSEERWGDTTSAALDPAKTYRFEAAGTYSYGVPGSVADAECAGTEGAGVSNVYGRTLAPTDLENDRLDLIINEEWVTWTPANAVAGECDPEHEYYVIYQPTKAKPVTVRSSDDNNEDNEGILTVRIYELAISPVRTFGVTSLPRLELAETVGVDARTAGSTSTVAVRSGAQYLLQVSGTWTYGFGTADAECGNRFDKPTFRREVDFSDFGVNDSTLLDLLVNGQDIAWVARDADAHGCSPTHTYRSVFVPAQNGVLSFVLNDSGRHDNGGGVTVKIFHIREIPLATFNVNSKVAGGTTLLPMLGNQAYNLTVSGTYNYGAGVADAECSNYGGHPSSTAKPDPVMKRERFSKGERDPLDLMVNGKAVSWTARNADSQGCSLANAYDFTVIPKADRLGHVEIDDAITHDNDGLLRVEMKLAAGG